MPNGGTIALERAADHDYPIAIATIPATEGQNRTAIAVIVVLVVVAILIAPFAHLQLARLDIFVPVLQTVLAVADLTTAVLLFAQYLILPQRALLAVASAYLCSASFAFLQTITFPGGYGPAGLIGDGDGDGDTRGLSAAARREPARRTGAAHATANRARRAARMRVMADPP